MSSGQGTRKSIGFIPTGRVVSLPRDAPRLRGGCRLDRGRDIVPTGIFDQSRDPVVDRGMGGEERRKPAGGRMVEKHLLHLRRGARFRIAVRFCGSAAIMASGFLVSSTAPASARYSRLRDRAKRSAMASKPGQDEDRHGDQNEDDGAAAALAAAAAAAAHPDAAAPGAAIEATGAGCVPGDRRPA